MPINSVKRKLVDSNGNVTEFTEQKYIHKYSTDYYHHVQETKYMEQFKQQMLKDFHKIDNCLKQQDVTSAIQAINQSKIFGFKSKSSQFFMPLMEKYSNPNNPNLNAKSRNYTTPEKKGCIPR